MILDHLRDQWGKSDIEKIIKELILLVAPTQSKENNFKVSIKTEEYKDIERNELTNDVLDLAFAEVKAYFIDNEDYFQRKAVFVDEKGKEFEDNEDRSIFFVRGVLETIKKLRWTPDIIHCHGWMTALTPL